MNKKITIICISSILLICMYSTIIYLSKCCPNSQEERYLTFYEETFPEASVLLEENKEYFNLVAESFEGKYDSFYMEEDVSKSTSSEPYNQMIWGEYYIIDKQFIANRENQSKSSHFYNTETADQYFDFTDDEINAFYHIIEDLHFKYIMYFLFEDGRYYLFFYKDNTSPYTDPSLSDPTIAYGIAYSSNGKSAPSEVYYFDRNQRIDSSKWFKAFHVYPL